MVVRALFLSFLVLSVAACKGKASKITEHEGARQTSEDTREPSVEVQNLVQSKFAQRMQISERINAASTAAGALGVATELEALVLNADVLGDPLQGGRSEFDVILGQFNRALNKAIELDEAFVRKSGILARYEEKVMAGCSLEGRGCLYLPVFRGDHLTSRILTKIAAGIEPDLNAKRANKSTAEFYPLVRRYYQLLSFAYELSNGQPVPELDQMYVANARDYFGYFRSLGDTEKQPDSHRRFRDALTLALGHLRNQAAVPGGYSERYCSFLIELNPLDPEMFKTMDLDLRSRRSMLAEFIQCTSQKGQLDAVIKQFVEKQNREAVELFKEHAAKP
jgi:hypothetical protein